LNVGLNLPAIKLDECLRLVNPVAFVHQKIADDTADRNTDCHGRRRTLDASEGTQVRRLARRESDEDQGRDQNRSA
jgi:hypothetical protein